jgi:glycosyltransferase involved in cell wall biosynthesis
VRNGERTVAQAISGILEQTVRSFELIVVDDGSTDDTAAIVGGFVDPRLRIFRTQGTGLTPALRLGISHAKSDISFPTRLERQLELFDRRPEVVVVGVNWEERDGTGRLLRQRRPFVPGSLGSGLLVANPIFHGAVAFRKEAAEAVGGYDLSFRFAQDYDLWLRMAEVGVVWNHDEVLAVRTMDGTNIAATQEKSQHKEALRARTRACRRRRNPVLWPLVARGTVSLIVPMRLKRPVRLLRGQAP